MWGGDMIKTFRLWQRADDLSAEEFKWRWLTQQAALWREAAQLSQIQRVAVSFLGPRQIAHYAPGHQVPVDIDFDAVESLYFDTVPDLRAALAADLIRVLEKAQLTDAKPHPVVPWTITLEEVMGEARNAEQLINPNGNLKIFRIVSRRRDMDRTQFRIYWHNNHARLESAGPFIGGTTLRTTVSFNVGQVIGSEGLEPATDIPESIDCTNEHYFREGAEPWVFYETVPFPAETRRDEMNFINFDAPVRRALMQEYVVVDQRDARK
jgi:hypothetical protein